jgi:protein-tyrosine phosphatase
MSKGRILFLCTGNYYRSRFAEELFNHYAQRRGVNWQASSRALALERGWTNVGPISRYAIEALRHRNIAPPAPRGFQQRALSPILSRPISWSP